MVRILALQTLVVSVSLPLNMMTVLEGYLTQILAAVLGLGVFVAVSFSLQALGLRGEAVAWSMLAGQMMFAAMGLGWIAKKARDEKVISSATVPS